MLAKSGPKVVTPYWSHIGKRRCDAWWENETEWHRRWKSCFPAGQREIVHFDEAGEKHVADVKTSRGMVIEFQNSPMPLDELRAREAFYGKMMWIVNGTSFKARFHILSPLPDPASKFAEDLVFREQRVEHLGRGFWRKSENPGWANAALVRTHSMNEIATEILENHRGHHLFDWKRPRDVWYAARAPVFFDLGGPELLWLQTYDDRGLRCIRKVRKNDVVSKNGGVHTV
jgi:competence protein CoiA